MQRTQAPLLVATAVALLLLGCNGAQREQAERERAAAARQRQVDALVSRCRQQQPAVQQQLQELSQSAAELTRLNQQRYASLPQPAAPDPAVLARYTRDDQEMELERHAQALARWQEADGAARRRWEAAQQARRTQLTTRELQANQNLLRLGVAATPEARGAWSRCEPQQLEAVALR